MKSTENKMSVYISVVIPVYNSEKNLDELYKRVYHTLESLCGSAYEIILVDDHSRDESYGKMIGLHRQDPNVKAIRLIRNYGQQNAIMCGLHHAKGEYILTLDDDLQHPPEEMIKMIKKVEEGYDVVFGIPIEKKHPWGRNLATNIIDHLLNWISNKPKDIRVSSFRVMKKEIVDQVIQDQTSFVYIAPMIFKITKNVENIFVSHDVRKHGQSNYNALKLMRLFILLILNYSSISRWLSVSTGNQFEIKDIE